jgi:transposase
VVRFLLLRALGGWSYDEVHAILLAVPSLGHVLGFRRIPAAPTVAAWAPRVPRAYLELLLGRLARRLASDGPVNLAGDGTGLALHRWEHWLVTPHRERGHHAFVKLHALVATRAQFPFFLAAHVTDARTSDTTEFPRLLGQIPARVAVGNVALDRGYLSRQNAKAIVDRGGRPVMALRVNITRITAKGVGAWSAMLRDHWGHRRKFRCRYRRRAVIEGVFGAFKDRLGGWVRSRRPEAQAIEILMRVVVWNALSVSYHRSPP